MTNKKARVLSVDKAFKIINLFKNNNELSLIEISRLLNIPKTTAFALIATIEEHGFLNQDSATGKYKLGFSVIEFYNALSNRMNIVSEAAALLRPISDIYEKNVHITMLIRNEVVYLESIIPAGEMTIKTIVGSSAPANCTSTGKAFLASLSETDLDYLLAKYPLQPLTPNSITDIGKLKAELNHIREVGYSIDNEESILGVKGVGIAVKNMSGKALIGISLAGLTSYWTDKTIADCEVDLRRVADKISVVFGKWSSL
jgi:IclR family transcriptional regulator, KDG regulon repressor